MRADAPPSDRARPSTSLCGVRVLAVDDDADAVEVLRLVLEGAGASVTTMTSARDALDALRGDTAFDVIVSDIGMPEMDGYAFIRNVRSGVGATEVPAIALTAYARGEDARQAMLAGYQEHVAKPVDPVRLLEIVKAWSLQQPSANTIH
jgi:CheY-like chemotaxis protein